MAEHTRDEIDAAYRWDVDQIYSSRGAWEDDLDVIRQYADTLQEYEGEVLASPAALHEALLLNSQIGRRLGTARFYARAKKYTHLDDPTYQEMVSEVSSLSSQISQQRSFLTPEIQEADREEVMGMVDDHPPLEAYRRTLQEKFRLQDHSLPKEQEELTSQISEVIGNEGDFREEWESDLDWPELEAPDGETVTVKPATRNTLLRRDDRDFRERVYAAFGDTYQTFPQLHAALYQDRVKSGEIFADIRDYDSKRHRKMKTKEIPRDVYDTLIETVRANADAQERYYDILQDALDVDTLQPWDKYMSLTGDVEPDIAFDEALDHVIAAVEPLGADYQQTIRDNADTWIDVYPHQGKRGGAFSAGTYDTEPFLLLNHTDDVDSLYTLAHELGHSMHRHLRWEEQPYQTAGSPIFTSEVASTVHEALLSDYLVAEGDGELRPHVLNQQINRISSTLMTQTMFAEFEHTVHERVQNGEPVTAEMLDRVYSNLLDTYQPGVEDHLYEERGWMRIPHFYRPYYVYQYATGISAALSITDAIAEEGEEAAERHKAFLRAGSSAPPIELLQDAGVDLTESDPVEDAIDTYRDLLDKMEELQ